MRAAKVDFSFQYFMLLHSNPNSKLIANEMVNLSPNFFLKNRNGTELPPLFFSVSRQLFLVGTN